jgi:hypothetical protein
MALEFDIKANDEFSASLEDAAAALQRIAKYEQQINGQSRALGKAYESALSYGDKIAKTERTTLATEQKHNALKSKESKEDEKRKDRNKESLKAVAAMGAALVAASTAAAALAYKLLDAGKSTYDARREAGALLDAWTGQRGPKALSLIDGMAQKIGLSFQEAREKFLAFREAGLNNKLSFKLIKIRQDLIALGLSAEAADKEVGRVTAVGHDPYARLRAINELERSFKGVGSGAFAAYRAMHSVEGAQVKLGNAVSPMLADFWKKVSPAIGDAAHRLADFVITMLKSEEAQGVITKLGDAIVWLASQVTSENLTTGVNVLRAGFSALATVFDVVGRTIALGASLAVDAVSWMSDKIGESVDWLVDNFPDGAALIDGFVDGIKSRVSSAIDAVTGVATDVAGAFAKALGIQSPSKVFAEYGRQTVAGYELGQKREIGEMPLQEAARTRPAASASPVAGGGLTIENLIVQGGANASADDIARAVRRELQLLLNAGALSRGLA